MVKALVILEAVNNRFTLTDQRLIDFALRICQTVDVLAINCNARTIDLLKGVNVAFVFASGRPIDILKDNYNLSIAVAGISLKYNVVLVDNDSILYHILCRAGAIINRCVVSRVYDIIANNVFARTVYDGRIVQHVSFIGFKPWLLSVKLFYPIIVHNYPKVQSNSSTRVQIISYYRSSRIKTLSCSKRKSEWYKLNLPKLTEADIVIAGGKSFGTSENFKRWLLPLAIKLGAAIGATHGAVESGCAPSEIEIGSNGKVISPKLYIAFGISGSDQHLVGINYSKIIVAINKDIDAPILCFSDYAIISDMYKAITEITTWLHKPTTRSIASLIDGLRKKSNW
ncbi:Electron transfer flavoprotein large subunit [Candidatus Hodgkinia cicadicola]|uniref:Electron transfer flavoprotein large subunit n=1 Tax=Candidatus Hodgkinia cicadicola TaxID=573658 RepID=A0ABX4MGH3_9HYPH|nr:Electron transfer flavoprotein large subunit [Candidatus Hodgkinia cicadicola]